MAMVDVRCSVQDTGCSDYIIAECRSSSSLIGVWHGRRKKDGKRVKTAKVCHQPGLISFEATAGVDGNWAALDAKLPALFPFPVCGTQALRLPRAVSLAGGALTSANRRVGQFIDIAVVIAHTSSRLSQGIQIDLDVNSSR